jgi:CPA2 family monovalent cation:H+ antiporter-2
MLIDPAEIVAHWPVVLAFLLAVIVGKIVSVTIGAFLMGQSVQTSVKTGMSLAQIGEFSFIIAGVGVASGATHQLLYSVAVAVSGITTLFTPWLIRASPNAAAWVDRKLPHRLQTFAALYASWLEQLGSHAADSEHARFRGAIRWLIVDTIVVAAIIIGASIEMDRVVDFAESRLNISEHTIRVTVVAGAALLTAPFWFGMVRVARYLGFELATRVFPPADREHTDLAAAPRRLLVVTLQLAIVLLLGVPLVAITQPFLPPFRGAAVLLLVLLLLAAAFWRGAANLQGHARAGAQALADALLRQTRAGRQDGTAQSLEDANRILAGLGSPVAVEIRPNNPLVGQSLAEIKLRGLTGATVLAIQRRDVSVVVPAGHERLQAGDVLALAGTHDAVEAARELLTAQK